MHFETLGEGFINKRLPGDPTPVAAGARCVVAGNGDLVCSYMVQSKLGINDFMMTLSRSGDGGKTWTEQGPIWPRLKDQWSLFANISRAANGDLFLFGSRCKIDTPGESFWSDQTQGLKDNEMIWSVSKDHGKTWTAPAPIPMPIPGSAEAPGPLVVTRQGTWVGPYSPYNTFDPKVKVDREQVVALFSKDQGKTWGHTSMLRFAERESGGAEAWCVELSEGRLLGTAWHIDHTRGEGKKDYPNKFAISRDGGVTWTPTRSTGIMGHTTALAAHPKGDGRALFLNVRRKPAADVGLWLAVVKPTDNDFGVQHDQLVWRAAKPTQSDGSPEHDNWTDFNFGEPCVTPLPDGTLLVAYWFIRNDCSGIGYVRLKMHE